MSKDQSVKTNYLNKLSIRVHQRLSTVKKSPLPNSIPSRRAFTAETKNITMKIKHKHRAVFTASSLYLTGFAIAGNLGDEIYTYDASGNIVEKSIGGEITKMRYDTSNKITSIVSSTKGSDRIKYDAAGRPISHLNAIGHTTRHISYGYENKVLNSANAEGNAELFYNAEGQLVGKSTRGELTPYTWDGNVMASVGAETFINEIHISGGVPVIEGDQSIVVSDHLGNTLSQGSSQLNSTAYGEGLEQGRFTGKFFVKELESYVFKHRLYSAETSNWTHSDPSGYPDGFNNLAYVGGDPLSQIDPFGLRTLSEEHSMKVGDVSGLAFSYNTTGTFAKMKYVGTPSGSIEEEAEGEGSMPIQVGVGGSCSYSRTNVVTSTWATTANITVTLWDGVTAQVGSSSGGGGSSGTGQSQSWSHPGGEDKNTYEVVPAKRKIIHSVMRTKTHSNTGTVFSPVWTACVPELGPYTEPGRTSYNATGINVYEL